MSIVFVGVGEDGVVFAGDGVATEPISGDVVAMVSKLLLFPELSCVMGFTGIPGAGRQFSAGIEGRYVDFDGLVRGVVDDCQELHEGICREVAFPDPSYAKMCVALGGWSEERQRFEAYRLMSYPKESLISGSDTVQTIPPWTLGPIEYMWASSAPETVTMERLRVDDSRDMVEAGIRWVCAARQDCGPDATGLTAGIGGYVQVANVDRSGIRSWIAHRWPEDVIGAPINPAEGEAVPGWLEPSSEGRE